MKTHLFLSILFQFSVFLLKVDANNLDIFISKNIIAEPFESNESIPTIKRQSYGTLHTLQNLSYWAYHEEALSASLKHRLSIIQKEIKLIQEYLRDYNETSATALKNAHKHEPDRLKRNEIIGSSFVLGHRMITRYTSAIRNLKDLLKSPTYKESKEEVNSALFQNSLNDFTFDGQKNDENIIASPCTPDHFMSSLAFMHLRQIYNYTPSELRIGFIFDTTSGGALNALNCAELGIFALKRKFYYMAVDWLELAKSMSLEYDTIPYDLVSSLLNIAIQESNDQFLLMALTPESKRNDDYSNLDNLFVAPVLETVPFSKRITGAAIFYKDMKTSSSAILKGVSQYMDLCRGNNFQTPEIQANLKCYYDNHRHPYLYINPVKVEHLSESPPLFQFYEVMGPKEMERIINSYSKYLALIADVGPGGIGDKIHVRTSVIGAARMNMMKFAEYFSGLKMFNSSEEIQLAEYTYGRYFQAHLDRTNKDLLDSSDPTKVMMDELVATFQYYLKVPTSGGLTPLSSAGVSGHHIPGSVLVWYNMYRNGSVRNDVIHGGCPVIHGAKLILNHWVRYGGNFRNFQCTLNHNE